MSRVRLACWDPDGTRYGIPAYPWQCAPAGLATRRQLAARRLGKAMAARRRCPGCGTDAGYVIPRSPGTCWPCAGSPLSPSEGRNP